MEEQLITLETAKLAKEKGFKEMCFAAFHKNNRNDGYFESGIISQSEYFRFPNMSNGDKIAVLQKDYIHTILRPTQSFLAKWLREKYDIQINITRMPPEAIKSSFNKGNKRIKKYNMWVWSLNGNPRIENPSLFFDNYEEALEIGLQKALNLINYENSKARIN